MTASELVGNTAFGSLHMCQPTHELSVCLGLRSLGFALFYLKLTLRKNSRVIARRSLFRELLQHQEITHLNNQ